MQPPLAGHADAQFEPVRTTFHQLFTTGAESGAGLAVSYQGRLVVDLCGGWRDPDRNLAWGPDTLVNTFSVSKPFAAMCVMLLVDRGQVRLSDRVASHWPEFSGDEVEVWHVLSHTAGLPVFPVPRSAEALGDWQLLVSDLAAASPHWSPGSVAAEHALTYGHLIGEIVRRVTGRSLGRFFADEIAGPWRLDLAFGLSAEDQARCADLGYGRPDWPAVTMGEPSSLRAQALGNPSGCLDLPVLNSPLWRAAEVPAVNLHATATSIARAYAGLLAGGILDGVRLFPEATVADMVRAHYQGPDLLLGRTVQWTLGMQIEDDGSWGMGGIGGSVGYADPDRGYSFGYVTRHLADFERVDALVEALHRCLER
ncbi:MAG TPA: serine hydrolase domain-containing protein [Micromonosporaceae bacterium]